MTGYDRQSGKTEGELWAEELLDELRRARFVPSAWLRFLSASFVRARHNRRRHARAHRQLLALAGVGLAACVSGAAPGRPLLATVAAGWWLLLLLMADWHLGMLERPDGRRLGGLGVANTLTLLRAAAVPLLPALAPIALGLAVLAAGLSDVADGWLARARAEASRFGAWLDGAVDGVLLSVAAVAAADDALVPSWVAALIVGRYLAPWLVIAGVYFASARAPSREGYVSGRAPGVVLVLGLALAALGVPGAAFVAAGGALGGLATFGATVVRGISRAQPARARAETAAPPPAAPRASRPDRDGSSASIGRRSTVSASRARTPG
jgi:cardiolipin synthase